MEPKKFPLVLLPEYILKGCITAQGLEDGRDIFSYKKELWKLICVC